MVRSNGVQDDRAVPDCLVLVTVKVLMCDVNYVYDVHDVKESKISPSGPCCMCHPAFVIQTYDT